MLPDAPVEVFESVDDLAKWMFSRARKYWGDCDPLGIGFNRSAQYRAGGSYPSFFFLDDQDIGALYFDGDVLEEKQESRTLSREQAEALEPNLTYLRDPDPICVICHESFQPAKKSVTPDACPACRSELENYKNPKLLLKECVPPVLALISKGCVASELPTHYLTALKVLGRLGYEWKKSRETGGERRIVYQLTKHGHPLPC